MARDRSSTTLQGALSAAQAAGRVTRAQCAGGGGFFVYVETGGGNFLGHITRDKLKELRSMLQVHCTRNKRVHSRCESQVHCTLTGPPQMRQAMCTALQKRNPPQNKFADSRECAGVIGLTPQSALAVGIVGVYFLFQNNKTKMYELSYTLMASERR